MNTPPMMAQTPVRKCVNDLSGAARTQRADLASVFFPPLYKLHPTMDVYS